MWTRKGEDGGMLEFRLMRSKRDAGVICNYTNLLSQTLWS